MSVVSSSLRFSTQLEYRMKMAIAGRVAYFALGAALMFTAVVFGLV